MIHESVHEARKNLHGIVAISGDKVEVLDAARLRASAIDTLVRDAVFGGPELMAFSRWLIWELGQALDARPASIHELYMAAGRGEFANSTVPAMNMRFMTYDVVRAALRAALKTNARSIIFEIARSEMGYTEQEPEEFTTVIIAAAIKEGYTGPLFVQGDHFQVKASKFATDPEGAIKEVKDLIRKAIPAGFWNIDIDTSTLVTLEPESLDEQQYHNYVRSAEITALVRELEPAGVTISLGGEIGEVGEKNSTTDELDAYLVNYNKLLATYGDNLAGSEQDQRADRHQPRRRGPARRQHQGRGRGLRDPAGSGRTGPGPRLRRRGAAWGQHLARRTVPQVPRNGHPGDPSGHGFHEHHVRPPHVPQGSVGPHRAPHGHGPRRRAQGHGHPGPVLLQDPQEGAGRVQD